MFVVMLYCKGNINLRLPIVETDSLQLPFSVIMKIIPTCYYRNKGEVENIFPGVIPSMYFHKVQLITK